MGENLEERNKKIDFIIKASNIVDTETGGYNKEMLSPYDEKMLDEKVDYYADILAESEETE